MMIAILKSNDDLFILFGSLKCLEEQIIHLNRKTILLSSVVHN